MFIKELSIEECFAMLAEKAVGRLACAHENQPYVVPLHFAFDGGECCYAFSRFGQKIEWMRSNPLVCIEVDEIKDQFEWASLVITGRFEELPEAPDFEAVRAQALELISRQPMWWQPAYIVDGPHAEAVDNKPIYFRIFIDKITGHRAVADES